MTRIEVHKPEKIDKKTQMNQQFEWTNIEKNAHRGRQSSANRDGRDSIAIDCTSSDSLKFGDFQQEYPGKFIA